MTEVLDSSGLGLRDPIEVLLRLGRVGPYLGRAHRAVRIGLGTPAGLEVLEGGPEHDD